MSEKKKQGVFKWAFKDFVNVSAWLHFDWVKQSFSRNIISAKGLFKAEQAKKKESFDEALKRLGIGENELKAREKEFLRLAIFYLFLAILVLLYTIYLAFTGIWTGVLLGFTATAICLVLAFRQHFWLFQIKNRKLGCTLSEWYNSRAGGEE